MKNIKYLLSILFPLSFCGLALAQVDCDFHELVSGYETIGEENDTLPMLDPPPPYESFTRSSGDYRMLYFIHGLNGSDESWQSAHSVVTAGSSAHQFPARMVYPRKPNYHNAQGTLEAARGSVDSYMDSNHSNLLPPEYNNYEGIAISHSQGGIVGRALDEYYSKRDGGVLINAHERYFGGLVTVATPNQGAMILNNEEMLQGLIYDLADNLSIGPITEFTSSSNFFVRLMAKLLNLEEMRQSVVNFVGNEVGSFLLAENMPGITKEYTVPNIDGGTGSKIEALNTYDPVVLEEDDNERSTDLVAFYAVADLVKTYNNVDVSEIVGFQDGPYVSLPNYETTTLDELIVPISWATIHFQLNSPNNGIDPFGADDEDYLTAYKAHKTKNFYDSKVLQNEAERRRARRAERIAIITFDIPALKSARSQRRTAQKRRDAWQRGSDILSKFDELYRIVIGARYSELVTETQPTYMCECTDLSTHYTFVFDCDRVEDFWDMSNLDCVELNDDIEVTTIVWRNKASDGVVLVESQMDIPQHTWEPQKLEGVTHMQVRNSTHTAEMLETVFEGEVGLFFYTEKK